MMVRRASMAIGILLLATLFVAKLSPIVQASEDCKGVAVIFARGSGEDISAPEAKQFSNQLDLRVPNTTHTFIELGKEMYSGSQYPAIDVHNLINGNALGAWISAGYANDYGDSVMEGESELIHRVADIHSTCPETRIVLAGYSQGAQVIGQYLTALSDKYPEYTDQIEFVALFGDPKLNLPEGRGFNPPACRKEHLSSWRRVVPNCDTDNGSLGARDPYLPDSMKNKVGLWCNGNDFICGSSKNPLVTSGHGDYYKEDGPIDQAVLEIANHLKDDIALQDVNLVPDMFKIPSGHPDVMVVLENSNENMTAWYDFVIPTTFAIADQVTKQGGRIGLQTFNGCAKKGYTYSTPLSNNPGPLEDTARSAWHMKPDCDLSEDLIRTLTKIKDSRDWKANRNKVIIVIPKVPFSSPGTTASTILNSQSDLHLYSIETDAASGGYEKLQIDSHKNTSFKLSDFDAILIENTTNPQVIANLRNPNISTLPGATVSFDASNSLVYDDTIKRYEWDFDGNGTIDQTTTGPIATHVYPSAFNGEMNLTVVATSGLSGSVARKVLIQSEDKFKHSAKAPINLKLTKLSDSSVRFSWELGDDSAMIWLIKLDGFPVGYTKKDQLYVNIKDISLNELHTFSVEAVVDDNTGGEAATISTKTLNVNTDRTDKSQEQEISEASNKQAAEILGDITKKDTDQNLNPAARAVAKLNPAAKSILRSSLAFIVVASLIAASVLGWVLYKRHKTLFKK